MLHFVMVPEVLIQKHEQGAMIARISSMLNPEKITSVRAISLPGELKGPDGQPLPKAATEVRLGADRVLVDLSDAEFLNLVGISVDLKLSPEENFEEDTSKPNCCSLSLHPIKFPGKV